MNTVNCPLWDSAQMSRHEPAWVSADGRMLYYELDAYATRAAGHLRRAGVVEGSRVAVFLPSDWRAAAILFGLWRVRAVACLISTRLPREAVLAQVQALGCSHLVSAVKDSAQRELAGAVVLDPLRLLEFDEGSPVDVKWMQDLRAPAVMVATSGSTGISKWAVLSYGNLYYNARASNANIRLISRDRWLLSLPLYHVSGLGILFRCLLAGAAVAAPVESGDVAAGAKAYEATHLSLVGTQLRRLLAEPSAPEDMARVKAMLVGGGPVAPGDLAEALRRRWPVRFSYGLTEMASQVCTVAADAPPAQRGSTGRPLRYQRVRVSEEGEVQVRGETLFMGYWEQGAIRPAVLEDGWFATGDLGRLDEHGCLHITGRRDAMFISGGENIQPEEIEQALLGVPGVEAAVVVPRADAEYGLRPVAFVAFAGAPVDDAALDTQLAQVLPRFKIPDAYLPWPTGQDPRQKPPRALFAKLV